VVRFHSLWPIFKARALADEGISAWGTRGADESRSEYRKLVFSGSIGTRDFSPSCFLEHQDDCSDDQSIDPARIPLDWEHTLAAIYMVRCNLFHGGKSFLTAMDAKFVFLSYEILSAVWWGSVDDV